MSPASCLHRPSQVWTVKGAASTSLWMGILPASPPRAWIPETPVRLAVMGRGDSEDLGPALPEAKGLLSPYPVGRPVHSAAHTTATLGFQGGAADRDAHTRKAQTLPGSSHALSCAALFVLCDNRLLPRP